MVVCKFGMRDVFNPCDWVISAVHPQVGFDFLVHTFSFSIGLWVISGGEGKVISEDSSEFFCEGRGKLQSAVRYDLFIEAKACVDFVEEKSGYPLSGSGFLGRTEDYPLHKPMVDHNQ